ncbi:UdgX family uracil-DNA binding protein [Microvirga thermotolerans]|uniref:UdgX family uracil-DNA binding protein n=1 Tax=Microvirga thermotolerans TaxID=2651334 RepID=UPI001FE79489|nr:UdgX family uracil-DNA binding protein [Microvirga thermotolerans]
MRRLIAEELAPQHVAFAVADAPDPAGRAKDGAPPVLLPRAVGEIVGLVVRHRDPERYALLYQLVWRVLNGERDLLRIPGDPLVHRLGRMARAVEDDIRAMQARLRFRRDAAHPDRLVARYEPEHFVLEAVAPFFADRFRSVAWTILTPLGCVRWDRAALAFGPPPFDPFRGAAAPGPIGAAIQTARARVEGTNEQESAMADRRETEHDPERKAREPRTLQELNAAIAAAGPLVPGATQAVFGEGPAHADIVFVGEQPGDQEDLQGRPFVGPAGRLFDRALKEVGIDRDEVYLTNAVKHFKFERRGHRRIHSKPTAGEVRHYRPWLMKELELVRPRLVVALGGTALLALTGKQTPISRSRGRARFGGLNGYVTVHPSYLLRLPDEETRRRAYEDFLRDLAQIRDLAKADPQTGELPLAAE